MLFLMIQEVESKMTNLDKYKEDLGKLIGKGEDLLNAIQFQCCPDDFRNQAKKILKEKYEPFIKALPSFKDEYQSWYSESLSLIKLLLPDRLNNFVKLYEKPKTRKEITYANYTIEDCLQGLSVTRGYEKEKVVGPDAAINQYQQQLNILKSCVSRFTSSLFDIKQLLQADLFDSELEAAKELNKKGFVRGAGAMAGVVLEGHLSKVCENHKVIISTKKPSINDYNQALKGEKVLEIHEWRFIQHLGDLRNLCDHDKKKEPSIEQIDELIAGVERLIKTLF